MMSDDMMIMMSDQLTILPNTKINLFSPGLLLHSAEDCREEQEEVGDLVNHGENRDEEGGLFKCTNADFVYLLISPKPSDLAQDIIKGHLQQYEALTTNSK